MIPVSFLLIPGSNILLHPVSGEKSTLPANRFNFSLVSALIKVWGAVWGAGSGDRAWASAWWLWGGISFHVLWRLGLRERIIVPNRDGKTGVNLGELKLFSSWGAVDGMNSRWNLRSGFFGHAKCLGLEGLQRPTHPRFVGRALAVAWLPFFWPRLEPTWLLSCRNQLGSV